MIFDHDNEDWTWRDEAKTLRMMPLRTLDRYIPSVVWRTLDFQGHPVTAEWMETFRRTAAAVKAERMRVRA